LQSCIDLSDPAESYVGASWLGLGPPLVIGVGFLLLGFVVMIARAIGSPEFFKRKPETASPHVIAGAPATTIGDE